MEGYVFDTGYVVYDPDTDRYITANVGIFRTKRNAEERCNRINKIYKKSMKVVKVNIVAVEE